MGHKITQKKGKGKEKKIGAWGRNNSKLQISDYKFKSEIKPLAVQGLTKENNPQCKHWEVNNKKTLDHQCKHVLRGNDMLGLVIFEVFCAAH